MKKELSLAVEAVQAIVNNTVCPDPAYGGCIGGPIPGYGCINEAASFALRRLNEVEDTSSRPVDNEKSILGAHPRGRRGHRQVRQVEGSLEARAERRLHPLPAREGSGGAVNVLIMKVPP